MFKSIEVEDSINLEVEVRWSLDLSLQKVQIGRRDF